MKRVIYKTIFCGLTLLTSLSSCSLDPKGYNLETKNSRDLNQESVILKENRETPSLVKRLSRRSRRLFARRDQTQKDTLQVQANFKTYAEKISEQDERDLSFVVSSAAEKSSISLALSQGEIKDALYRIREVHPLALIEALAENPALIEGMKKMQGRDWIWNLFLTQLSEVFSQAWSQGVISEEDIAAFASTLGLDSGTVASIVQGERWPELVDIVIT
ncbi:hypothetical protein CpB0904 [Chlamydia pneumoniae TW-183]|uniref:Probable lipoprotein CPn_0875/CP_0994/CPj0875/CpB0904 n=3 Tax=Chlamydia pneumoniae TaxID=83558 RepID=Y875_CHLPN|nr:lipoprotein [Chlamydia pneumoniae]Q9Z731.1 RecName: Full=Probable lipoprotein CPn_0875/CP_0994/CPj0875/CpB0904; Flags: Precursor [Chlamydia pneumoniae]AAD19013.1 CT734 hypothetical protein [Chlamydia pneumoniae CWL029]AAF38772.1 conserved hypothetical protein [Chlamydia pneumoniae AR39]AAP98833.1 hypothetical protein CpB0904 [Chlamydia pneumoniae TW-183]CRI33395.1 Probable lipoprotein CPn_0875/CP_0994/CPj0875/CpB0904 [Chlamydia pneumoniae]CRI36258.1 Probable lipoprotein CPn_0875/CP_0994/CP